MWQRLKNALIRLVCLLGIWAYTRLLWPFKALWIAGLAPLVYFAAGKERRLALENLQLAYPDWSLRQRKALVRSMTRHLARSLFEALELLRKPEKQLDSVDLDDAVLKMLRERLADGRGLLFITGHIGNWELLAAALCRAGLPLHGVVRKSYDALLDRFVKQFRAGYGLLQIDRDDPDLMANVRQVLDNGGILLVLLDQHTRGRSVQAGFFGQPVQVPSGALALAVRQHAPIVVGALQREGKQHKVVLDTLLQPDAQADLQQQCQLLGQQVTTSLEAVIRRHPEQWVWFHDRFKTSADKQSTPAEHMGS